VGIAGIASAARATPPNDRPNACQPVSIIYFNKTQLFSSARFGLQRAMHMSIKIIIKNQNVSC